MSLVRRNQTGATVSIDTCLRNLKASANSSYLLRMHRPKSPAKRSQFIAAEDLAVPSRETASHKSVKNRKMKLHLSPLLFAYICLMTITGFGQSDSPPSTFRADARYVAIGDSITQNGWYVPYVEMYYLTRYPKRKLDAFNCGINGDTAEGGSKRYTWDIAPHKPTVATIFFGMNDVGRDNYREGKTGNDLTRQNSIDNYEKHLRELVKLLQTNNVETIVILPTIFDNTAIAQSPQYPGLNEALGECANRARKIANELGCKIIDFYHPMLEVTKTKQSSEPAFSMISSDRVHPTAMGQFYMAYLFLMSQHAPEDVAQVSVNAITGMVVQTKNCQVENVRLGKDELSFRYTAKAVPFPVEKMMSESATWIPFMENLNREILQITSLSEGTYQVTFDNQPILECTAEELARGLNLAAEKTPQAKQSQHAWALYRQRQEYIFALRAIARVERSAFAPETPRPITLQEIEPKLQAYLKRAEGSRWFDTLSKEVNTYRKCKADEAEMRLKVDSLMNEIRGIVQPLPHIVRISRKTETGKER